VGSTGEGDWNRGDLPSERKNALEKATVIIKNRDVIVTEDLKIK